MGCIAFSPLQQGLLTSRYLDGTVPAGSRASIGHFLSKDNLTPELLAGCAGSTSWPASAGSRWRRWPPSGWSATRG